MKHIYHLFIFAVGIGLGIWIGVKFPSQAQKVAATEDQQAAKIQAAVSQEKITLLQQFMGKSNSDQNNAEFKQMLSDEKQKLQNATAKLGN
ncbi:MAG: hypothetical protein ABSB42_19925 [Tepidisphaeraceae bacterium]|jgi:uncharacterized membrane protein